MSYIKFFSVKSKTLNHRQCPYVGRHMEIYAGKEFGFLCEGPDGELHLKKDDNYFFQGNNDVQH